MSDFLMPIITGFNAISQNSLARQEFEYNKQIDNLNFQQQKENLEYQKALQQEIFQREDTAYQRTVNDMRSAGLSPLTMGSTNNAGTVVSTTAPQRVSQDQTNRINAMNNVFNGVLGMANTINQTVASHKQNEFVQTQIDSNNIDNITKNLRNIVEIRGLLTDLGIKEKELANYDTIFEDMLQNSLSQRNLNQSQADLNKEKTQYEKDYNSLHELRKNILSNESTISDYKRSEAFSELNRVLRDNAFMERLGITDSMPEWLKDIGIDFSDSDVFAGDNPNKSYRANSEYNGIRGYRRSGRAIREFKDSAGSSFEKFILDVLGKYLSK